MFQKYIFTRVILFDIHFAPGQLAPGHLAPKFAHYSPKGAVAIRDSTTQEGAGRFLSRLLVDLET